MSTRSQQKRITKEAQILRHLRIQAGLSLNQAGRKCAITGSAIAHIEQGRMDISRARIEAMVDGYGCTMEEFYEYMDGKPVPMNLRDECQIILRTLDPSKLTLAHGLLSNLAK
jgi:transcriptional regulator with XRE-family HTH domain